MNEYFQYIAPYLLIALVFFKIARRFGFSNPSATLIIPSASLLIVLIPIQGLSAGDILLSFNPSFSIGSIALLMILLIEKMTGKVVLAKRDFLLFSLFNVALFSFLSASSLGFIPFDAYAWGYGFSALFPLMAALTILLVFLRNPLSWIFIAIIIAYDLKLLFSENFFDYITDGVAFLFSAVYVLTSAVKFSIFSRAGVPARRP